eukprot:99615-Prorocentrum_minimum.AAC.2
MHLAGGKPALIARLQSSPDPREATSAATSFGTTDTTVSVSSSRATSVAAATTTPAPGTTTTAATRPTPTGNVAVDRILKGEQPQKLPNLARGWARKVEGARPRPPQ